MPTPSRPWRLLLVTPGDLIYLPHRSKKAVYEQAAIQQQRAESPEQGSRVFRISVQRWDVETGRWAHCEYIWRRGA